MKTQLSQYEIDFYFKILEDQDHYEKIRTFALILMKHQNQLFEVTEGECKIIFNPYRVMLFERIYDEVLEHFFDVEIVWGNVELRQQKNFKKAFITALREMAAVDFFNDEN